MVYELWDMISGNLAGSFTTEGEAIRLVQDALDTNGPRCAAQLALVREHAAGWSETLYEGEELVTRAEQARAGRITSPESQYV